MHILLAVCAGDFGGGARRARVPQDDGVVIAHAGQLMLAAAQPHHVLNRVCVALLDSTSLITTTTDLQAERMEGSAYLFFLCLSFFPCSLQNRTTDIANFFGHASPGKDKNVSRATRGYCSLSDNRKREKTRRRRGTNGIAHIGELSAA